MVLFLPSSVMPIQRPPPPAGVELPVPPHDPPTLEDVVDAKAYQARVNEAIASQDPQGPTAYDAARADIYKASIIMAHSAEDGVPTWFKPAVNKIMGPMAALIAKTRNYQLHDGGFVHFVVVPFVDGGMPTEAPHHLPPLLSAAAIRALTADQITAYLQGYALGDSDVGELIARRAAIGRAIGCTVHI